MAQVSSSGVASGLDVQSIVSQLVAIERRPIEAAQQRQIAVAAKSSAFSTIRVSFANLKSTLTPLQLFSSFQSKLASSSDTTVATVAVTDAKSAIIGSSTIQQVVKLAKAQILKSGSFASSTASVGTGTLKIRIGSGAEVSITIDSDHSNLTQIKDKINAANAGVTAFVQKIKNDEYRLVLQASQTGADNTLQIDVTEDVQDDEEEKGLSQLRYPPTSSAPDDTKITEAQAPIDAEFILNGLTLTRSSNTITDAIDGVTLTLLKQTTADAGVSINVTSNTAAVKGNIESFVASYNEVIKGLNSAQTFDSKTNKAAPLLGNTTAQAITNSFRLLPKGIVPDLDGPYRSLSDLGILAQQDGTLTIDSAKLNAALVKDPQAVGRVFALFDKTVDATVVTPTSGIAERLFKAVSDLLDGRTGRLPSAEQGLRNASATIDKEIVRLEERVTAFEQRTRAKFARLEGILSRIQGIGSALNRQITQLENLTSFIARRNNSSSIAGGG
ncbi:MAG: flagellar filament capping protein FliD [Nitrospirae bacterium]|nr:flagellar filament capping protein FliD [Candidatus Troglogloeales bacterium]